MIKEKINNIQKLLKEQNIDELIIGNFGHQIQDDLLYYILLKNLEVGIMNIPKRGKPILYAVPFEIEQLSLIYPEIYVRQLEKNIENYFKKTTIGYRPSSFPSKQNKKNYIALRDEEKVMSIKLKKEQNILKKATKITDNIFADIIKHWRQFKTEADVAKFILKKCIEYDVIPSFPPIIASGKNAANPHHYTKNQKLKQGFCVIDMGVRYKGYCSDMTRTVYIGKPTKKEELTYEHLLSVQSQAVNDCKEGAFISDISSACRKNLGTELNKYFIHSLGHGLGTQVHEWPPISLLEYTYLENGMVITIEPGVYVPQRFGIRIEDDILITKKGPKIFTESTKNLIQVSANL